MSAWGALVLAYALSGLACDSCSNWKPVAKTVDQAAIILCDIFFSSQPTNAKLSPEDVEKAFCATAEQVAPFLASAKRAVANGGAVREAEGK